MQTNSIYVNKSPSFSELMLSGALFPIMHTPPKGAVRRINPFGDDDVTPLSDGDNDPLSNECLSVLAAVREFDEAMLKCRVVERTGLKDSVVHKALMRLVRKGLIFSSEKKRAHYTHSARLVESLKNRVSPATLLVISRSEKLVEVLSKTPNSFRKMKKVFEEMRVDAVAMRSPLVRALERRDVVKEIRGGETWLKVASAGFAGQKQNGHHENETS